MICPHCKTEFDVEQMEELAHPTLSIVRKHQERSSWAEIARQIKDGTADRILSVEDIISCTMKNGEEILIDVAGMGIYAPNDVIFCFHNIYGDNRRMNNRNTNEGGYLGSNMPNVMDKIFNKLPDDLQEVISPFYIKQEFNSSIYEGTAKLWLPSLVEICGDTKRNRRWSGDVNDKPFPLFELRANRMRKRKGAGEYDWYWLRSPSADSSINFYSIYDDGSSHYSGIASDAYGVLPCFTIR